MKHIGLADKGWEQMQMLLDAEMPVKRKRPLVWWISGLAAAATVVLAVTLFVDMPLKQAATVGDQDIAELQVEKDNPGKSTEKALVPAVIDKDIQSEIANADLSLDAITNKQQSPSVADNSRYVAKRNNNADANSAKSEVSIAEVVSSHVNTPIDRSLAELNLSEEVLQIRIDASPVLHKDIALNEFEMSNALSPLRIDVMIDEPDRRNKKARMGIQAGLLSDNITSYGGLMAGLNIDVPLSNKLSLSTGLSYAKHYKDGFSNNLGSVPDKTLIDDGQGFSNGPSYYFNNESDIISAELVDELHMLYVPVVGKYAASRSISFFGGAHFGWLLNSKLKDFYATGYDQNLDRLSIIGEGGYTRSKNLYNKFDVQGVIGAEFNINEMITLGASYNAGLVNILKQRNELDLNDASGIPSTENRHSFEINTVNDRASNRYFQVFLRYNMSAARGV